MNDAGDVEVPAAVFSLFGAYELLTSKEKLVLAQLAEVWNGLCEISAGPIAGADLGELVVHVHALQHAVMAQAAARAYPNEYRKLGATLPART